MERRWGWEFYINLIWLNQKNVIWFVLPHLSPLIFLFSDVSVSFSVPFVSSDFASSSSALGRSSSSQIRLKKENEYKIKLTKTNHKIAHIIILLTWLWAQQKDQTCPDFWGLWEQRCALAKQKGAVTKNIFSWRQLICVRIHEAWSPVLGWTLKGLFSKWLTPLLTLTSSRG